MTDQIPADDLRRFIARCRTAVNGRGSILLDELEALLPAPPRPTLADMTDEERHACQWMQADIIGGDEPLVIARIDRADWSAVILDRNGRYDEVPAGAVTPRPDLPRMEWPGTEKPEGVTPVKVGDVIESADDPRIASLPDGSVLFDCDGETVAKRSGEWVGIGYIPIPDEGGTFGPWTVLHTQKEEA